MSELTDNLDRLLPTSLQEADVSRVLDDFLKFLYGMTKHEHEEVLMLLPGRPIFKSLPNTPQFTSAGITSSRQNFVDILAYHAIISYIRYVSPYEIIAHLLRRLRARPGAGIRRLVMMMSPRVRIGLFDELIRLDDEAGKDRYGIIEEFERTLDTEFGLIRPGFVDVALSELIARAQAGKKKSPKSLFELHALWLIRGKRRRDPNRLPKKIATVADVRFLVEEANRELFVYPGPDLVKAGELLFQVHQWYLGSKICQAIHGNPIYMEIMRFFSEMISTVRALRAGWEYKEQWKAFVVPFLTSERFWHNLAGLNGDVPLMETEAGVREVMYRRTAVIGPVILMLPIVLPVVIMIAIRVPGATIRLVRWVGAQLVLVTQYAYSVYRVYGFLAGTGVVARDAYVFYITHPVEVNQALVAGTEAVLDLFGQGSGMAPGSSPADMLAAAEQSVANVAADGISEAATELKSGEAEIDLVEFAASTADGKLVKVTAKITDNEGGKVKVVVQEVTPVVEDFDKARKEVVFFSKPVEGVAQDAKGLGEVHVALPPSSPLPDAEKLLDAPAFTKIAGKRVKSWSPDALVGTSKRQMRNASLAIIKAKTGTPNPLAEVLVNGAFKNGGNKAEWAKDARYLEAAHVRSSKAGGPDVIVLMSAKYNRQYSADLEQAGTPGAIALDEVFEIGGIAIHKQTARDLVEQGWLDASALEDAKVINLREIELGTDKAAQEAKAAAEAASAKKAAAAAEKERATRDRGTGPDARMTATASKPVDMAAVGGGGLLPKPAFTKIAGRRVKSWNPDTLIGTSQDQMRDASLAIIKAKTGTPNPLAKVLVDGAFKNGGNKAEWAKDARYLEAAHVRSSKAGGPDVIILMSAKYNRKYSADLEQGGTPGAIVLDEVLDIGGIGMDRRTAWDLVEQKWLDRSVVEHAKKIDLSHLDI